MKYCSWRSTLYFGPLTKTTPQTGLKSVVLSWASFCSAMFSATHVYIVESKTPAPIMHCTVQRQTSHYWHLSLFHCAKLLQLFFSKVGLDVAIWMHDSLVELYVSVPYMDMSVLLKHWAQTSELYLFVSLYLCLCQLWPLQWRATQATYEGAASYFETWRLAIVLLIHTNNCLIMHILKCIWQVLCFF